MTCTETRTYLENNSTADTPAVKYERQLPMDIADHLQTCAPCRNFVADRAELQRLLTLARNTTPQTSAALDATVLANFRRSAERISAAKPVAAVRPLSVTSAWLWRGAVAAIVLLAALSLALRSHAPKHQAQIAQPPAPSQTAQPEATTHMAQNVTAPKAAPRPKRHTKPQQVAAVSEAPAIARDSFPPGFTSLMYCDPLSCNGPMDIIRMQLPATSAGRTQSSPAGFTYADVLVGADGVARGIRILQ